ncbi:unnamed protein product [Enterobius vermicularis]|uniref:Carn_acyltransf domain-containing protein n=1 Tax=Enterobius vermicularis TaxID=51028 RepID=A0A0N4VGJ4_ENTVE|nr:unnamed protein product [Enterobius vermicularis]
MGRCSALPFGITLFSSSVKHFGYIAGRRRLALNPYNSLPKPPVPKLEHTLSRYLEYADVVAGNNRGAFEKTKIAAKKFLADQQHLQEKLEKIAKHDENWVSF